MIKSNKEPKWLEKLWLLKQLLLKDMRIINSYAS